MELEIEEINGFKTSDNYIHHSIEEAELHESWLRFKKELEHMFDTHKTIITEYGFDHIRSMFYEKSINPDYLVSFIHLGELAKHRLELYLATAKNSEEAKDITNQLTERNLNFLKIN